MTPLTPHERISVAQYLVVAATYLRQVANEIDIKRQHVELQTYLRDQALEALVLARKLE